MGKKSVDLIGQRFGKLIVIKRTEEKRNKKVIWECQCDCGNIHKVATDNLKNGHIKSCGCQQRIGKHGNHKHRLYSIHACMKNRCSNKNYSGFKNYGERGIAVCNEWLNKENGFVNFYNWATANGYADNLTIDRINNDGNYEPSNCRWVTTIDQANNTRRNKNVEINGQTFNIRQWSKITGIHETLINNRYNKGKRGLDLIKPVKAKNKEILVKINEETYNLSQWSKITGILEGTLWDRYKKGMRGSALIAPIKVDKIEINGELHSWSEWENITGIKSGTLWMRYKRGKRGAELIEPVKKQ